MTTQIEYLARLTCACGRTAEATVYVDRSGCLSGYGGGCAPELEYEPPDGWLGGYDDANPLQCPTCVELRRG